MNVSTDIISSITARPTGHAVVLVLMSVSTFITTDILYTYLYIRYP